MDEVGRSEDEQGRLWRSGWIRSWDVEVVLARQQPKCLMN